MRTVQLKDFKEAMAFVNKVAEVAEEANHHPDITIKWNIVTLTQSTHVAGGLTEHDFRLARRLNELLTAMTGCQMRGRSPDAVSPGARHGTTGRL